MYRIIGVDGREYGPVSAGQLATWIAEGRVNAETNAVAEGSMGWKPLGSYPEFFRSFGKTPPPLVAAPAVMASLAQPRKVNGFAVAGLTLGILSFCCCCCCYGAPFNLLGLVFSILGLAQIANNPHLYEGKAIAITGLVLSLLSILCAAGLLTFSSATAGWRHLPHHTFRL